MYQCRNCTQDTKNKSENTEGQLPSADPAPETSSQYEKEQVVNTSYYNLGSALKDSDLLQRMFRKANFTISDDAMSEEVGDKNYSAMADRNILEGYFGIDPKKYEGLEKTIVCVLTTKTGEKHLGFYTNQDEDRARKGAKTQALLSSSIKQHGAEPSKNHSLNSPTEQQIMTNHEKAKKQLMDAFDEAVSFVGEEYVARALCGLIEQSKKEYEAANLNAFVEELFELEQLFHEDKSKCMRPIESIRQPYSPESKVPAKVTLEDIEANIVGEYYFSPTDAYGSENTLMLLRRTKNASGIKASLDRMTFCVLVLRNGFVVTGESSCVSPETFNIEVGRKVARENAISKIWPLMGYELSSKLRG